MDTSDDATYLRRAFAAAQPALAVEGPLPLDEALAALA